MYVVGVAGESHHHVLDLVLSGLFPWPMVENINFSLVLYMILYMKCQSWVLLILGSDLT